MNDAQLTSITIENFKSFKHKTKIPFAPLTIIIGRNNSGKSTLIQSLLLLKQTLNDPRRDIMLKLDGIVEAFTLRELTFGWPAQDKEVKGPIIVLEWRCNVDVEAALKKARHPDLQNLAKHSGIEWLEKPPSRQILQTSLELHTIERQGSTQISKLVLLSKIPDQKNPHPRPLTIIFDNNAWSCQWGDQKAQNIEVEFDHFVPYLQINRSKIGPRHNQRAWHNAYLIIFEQPLEALKTLLSELHYLGSERIPPPSLFKPSTTDPDSIGVSGEFAAQLLHRRQNETVHFFPPIQLSEQGVELPEKVLALPLIEAVNQVMEKLSITTPLCVEDIMNVGFHLKFGGANLVHVGRGLSYLLPLIELSLFADPLRFTKNTHEMSLQQYDEQCTSFSHIALEEPEAHIHPKVASRLAHWFVSLAMTRRRLIIETHSDHLVRRVRGLVARAGRGSPLEEWLLKNVVVLSVTQDKEGCSKVETSRLSADGGITENWPSDFMDESTDEESAIYYAKLDKSEVPMDHSSVTMVEGDEPEQGIAP